MFNKFKILNISKMASNVSCSNVTFDYLKGSSDFLNIVLNNICSCVLFLDREMRLNAFNDAMKTVFSNKKNEHLLYVKCGEAIGCAFQVEEEKECGKTSYCNQCVLRESALLSYVKKEAVYKEKISREFYTAKHKKEMKHLEFSTRPFYFSDDYYIIMIVNDITHHVEHQKIIHKQAEEIQFLLSNH